MGGIWEGGRSSRGGRRTQERIFLERLKREAAQEPGDAGDGVLRAVINVHGDDEHHGVGHDKDRDKPGPPFLEMLHFPVPDAAWGDPSRVPA